MDINDVANQIAILAKAANDTKEPTMLKDSIAKVTIEYACDVKLIIRPKQY